MEKLVRVSCKLPKGVIVKTDSRVADAFAAADEMVERAWADFFKMKRRSLTYESNVSIELKLEVPAGLENEVAELLAKMARELRGIE